MLGRYATTKPHPSPGWDVYTRSLKGFRGRQAKWGRGHHAFSTAVARGEGSGDVNVTVSTNRKWRRDRHPGDSALARKDTALADSWPCADPDLTTSLAVISYKLTSSHFFFKNIFIELAVWGVCHRACMDVRELVGIGSLLSPCGTDPD